MIYVPSTSFNESYSSDVFHLLYLSYAYLLLLVGNSWSEYRRADVVRLILKRDVYHHRFSSPSEHFQSWFFSFMLSQGFHHNLNFSMGFYKMAGKKKKCQITFQIKDTLRKNKPKPLFYNLSFLTVALLQRKARYISCPTIMKVFLQCPAWGESLPLDLNQC